jgi:tRNA modification GTPase
MFTKSFSFPRFPLKNGLRFQSSVRTTSYFASKVEDTIYALSSGTLTKSGVAVVRLSGPNSLFCFEQLQNIHKKPQALTPRLASLRSLFCPFTKEMIDKALILWFPAPKSFTGEDIVEFHIHGSRAVVSALFTTLERLNSQSQTRGAIRPAEPGEFTRRAFENGKMDLTEVEGLSDLLAAETATQRKQALRQMEGHLKVIYENWR